MKKLLNIGAWTGGLVLMISLLAFSENCREEVRIGGLEIVVDHNSGQYFISEKEVEKILRSEYPFYDSLLCREININLLEERLDNHPSIRKAEVYSALDGVLKIQVSQRQPVFRVQSYNRDYYIDEAGDSMALSPQYSAKAPLVTGEISAKTEAEIFDFFMQLRKDEYFDDFFHGIQVEKNGEWILYPQPGRHKVFVGKPTDLTEKMEKLRIFYDRVVGLENLDSIKALNLAYNKQVVCTKY